jgi:hypothetical protein
MNNPYAPPNPPLGDEPELRPTHNLPFSGWYAIGGGAVAGLLLRLIFRGNPGDAYAAMLSSFVIGAPLVVACVTVWLAERIAPRSWAYYFFAPLLSTTLFVVGTLALFIEGWICAVVILPLFAIVGGLAGLIMGAICRVTRWPRRSIVGCFAALPLLGGAVENQIPAADRERQQTREVFVAAPVAAVWAQLIDTRDIHADEIDRAWMYRIGVPTPLDGRGDVRDGEHLRHIVMARGVSFDQVAATWREQRQITWRYRFRPDSFPAGALDDHVRIGGRYFDIVESTYTLAPRAGGTVLQLSTRYRVTTHFNWYAGRVGDFLVGDFEETVLDLYARRAQRAVQPGS